MAAESKVEEGDGSVSAVSLPLSQCPVSAVTVFKDRAEVTREVRHEPQETGSLDVVVEGVTSCLDRDSLRVKGTGQCEILEVSYETHYISRAEEEAEEKSKGAARLKDLRAHVRALEDEMEDKNTTLARLRERGAFMQSYTQAMMRGATEVAGAAGGSPPHLGAPPAASMGDGSHDYVRGLLEFHEAQKEELDIKMATVQREVRKLQEDVGDLQREMSKLEGRLGVLGNSNGTKPRNDVTISLNVTGAEDPIDLQLTYMVSNASWSPAYDVRVSSEDESMVLTYYGNVRQSTSEDWRSCTVSLSTATPNAGGTPPELPQQTVHWKAPPMPMHDMRTESLQLSRAFGASCAAPAANGPPQAMHAQMMMADQMIGADGFVGGAPSGPPPPRQAAAVTATVESSGAGSSTFVVPRDATIDSDNKPHKLTIAIVELKPRFMLYVAPAYSPHAYLQAKTRNTSDFPFLASPKANVFFDGSFVTTTSMKQVHPGEVFQSFLGVDSSIKVDFRPVRERRRTEGMWAKSNCQVYERCTVLTNNKNKQVRVVLADVFPRSTDEKIRVDLIEPPQESLQGNRENEEAAPSRSTEAGIAGELMEGAPGRDSVMQNRLTNNIVWLKHVDAGETIEVPFSYSVAYPVDREIEIS